MTGWFALFVSVAPGFGAVEVRPGARARCPRLYLARLGEPYQHRVAFFRRLAGGAGRMGGQARGAGRDGRV